MQTRDEIMYLTRNLAGFSLTRASELPRIPLYMEQVTQLFEDMFSPIRRNSGDKVLTRTMINNYAKEGTLHRPNNKRYDRAHMIKLIYIFLFKHVLSIQDIKSIFDMLGGDDQIEEIYDCLLDEIGESHPEYERHVDESITRAERRLRERGIYSDTNLKVLAMTRLLMEAICCKSVAERLIDGHMQAEAEKKEVARVEALAQRKDGHRVKPAGEDAEAEARKEE